MRRVSSFGVFALVSLAALMAGLVGVDRAAAAICASGPEIDFAATPPPVEPTITGTPAVGQILTVSLGKWKQSGNPTECGVLQSSRLAQWTRDGNPIDGATAQDYTVGYADQNAVISARMRACSTFGFCTWVDAANDVVIPELSSPTPVSPRAGEVFRDPTGTAVDLKIAGNDLGSTIEYESSTGPGFTTTTLLGTTALPSISFAMSTNNTVYFWRARFRGGPAGCPPVGTPGPWSSSSFALENDPLDVQPGMPFLDAVGVSVNEATGNVVVSAPSPAFASLAGTLSAAVTYNSHGPMGGALGDGWDVGLSGSGATVPLRLVDHAPSFDAVEVVYAGGISRWFAHSAATATGPGRYDAPAGETAALAKDASGGFTLSDEDGSTITFTQHSGSTTVWDVASAVLPVSKGSSAKLNYTFDTATMRILTINDPLTSRTLTFTYSTLTFPASCSGGSDPILLCITGPDANVAYRYTSKAGWTTNHLYRVIRVNGTPSKQRVLAEYGYDTMPTTGAGRLQSIRSANDVNSPNDPNAPRSTAFAWNAAHQVAISYDPLGHGAQISESPVTTDAGTQTRTWTIDYTCGALTLSPPVQSNHAQPTDIARARANWAGRDACAQVRAPNQQPSGPQSSVQFDRLLHPLEQIDELGRHTRQQYDARGLLFWSEDAYGYPTDYVYDAITHVLTSVESPGPNPADVQANRPTTRYGYDEALPDPDGAGPLPATATNGLQAAFFTGTDLAGVPAEQRTEIASSPNLIDTGASGWDATLLPSTISPTSAYSIRWRGYIYPPATAAYDFQIHANGAVRLWIDGQLVLNDWTPGAAARDLPASGLAEISNFTATPHSITLEYAHPASATLGETQLKWKTSGAGSFTSIPLTSAVPGWLNQTSTLSPGGLLSSAHFKQPWRGLPDYTNVVSADTTGGAVKDHITSMQYDDYGRMTSKTLPNGNSSCTIQADGTLPTTGCGGAAFTTTYTYWSPGDLATNAPPSPPSGCSPGSAVDTTGLARSVQQNAGTATPATATKTWYDVSGRPTLKQRGAGVWCMQYNDEGRLSVQYAPGEVTVGSISAPQRRTFTYDPEGALRTVTGGDSKQATASTLTFDYDEAGRLRKATNALTEQSQYGYDADSNITTRRAYTGGFPAGTNYTTTYLYDAADQLTQQTDPAARVYKFGYDARGQLIWTWYPNTTLSWNRVNPTGWTLDTYARPCPAPTATCGGIATAPVTPSDSPPGSATADFADWNYNRNQDGKIMQETRTGTGLTATTNAYIYDAAGRLASAITSGGASVQRTFAYDLDSNRTSDVLNTTTTTTYSYDSSMTSGWPDALFSTTTGATKTCYVYDTDGRQISKRTYSGTGACTSTASRFATWDGRDRINGFSATSASGPFSGPQKYDPLDRTERRLGLAAANDRWYLYAGMEDDPTFEKSVSSGAITRTHIPGPAGDLAEYAGVPTTASTVTYHYYNAHGDLSASATQAGARVNTYANEPFGKPTQYQTGAGKDETPASDTALERYTGRWDKRYDTSWTMIEMGARPYDPVVGKFLSPDPVDGGSANNYDYAQQDPVNEYDLDGTCVGPAARFAPVCFRVAVRMAGLLGGGSFAAAAGSSILRKVIANPQLLKGASGSKLGPQLQRIARMAGWTTKGLGRGAKKGKGYRMYDKTNLSIRFNPGGTRRDPEHFGGQPYWTVSSTGPGYPQDLVGKP